MKRLFTVTLLCATLGCSATQPQQLIPTAEEADLIGYGACSMFVPDDDGTRNSVILGLTSARLALSAGNAADFDAAIAGIEGLSVRHAGLMSRVVRAIQARLTLAGVEVGAPQWTALLTAAIGGCEFGLGVAA